MRPHSTICGFPKTHGPRRSRPALYASYRLTSSVQLVDLQGISTKWRDDRTEFQVKVGLDCSVKKMQILADRILWEHARKPTEKVSYETLSVSELTPFVKIPSQFAPR
jgi:hypothetical protein